MQILLLPNTEENRRIVSKLILSEVKQKTPGYYGSLVMQWLSDTMIESWEDDDDKFNEACETFASILHESNVFDEDGIPLPRPLPHPECWPPGDQ
jgi:hypothetical protein